MTAWCPAMQFRHAAKYMTSVALVSTIPLTFDKDVLIILKTGALEKQQASLIGMSHYLHVQFRALSDQLYGTPVHHSHVRHAAVQQLRAHPDAYAPFVESDLGGLPARHGSAGHLGRSPHTAGVVVDTHAPLAYSLSCATAPTGCYPSACSTWCRRHWVHCCSSAGAALCLCACCGNGNVRAEHPEYL